MQTNSNIEDFFKSKLSGLQIDPSPKTWSKVDNTLNDQAMESLFQEKLANQLVTPNKAVWKSIAGSLSTIGFWHFGLKSLNIYTATIAASVIGILLLLYPFQKTNSISTNPKKITSQVTYNNSSDTKKSEKNNSFKNGNNPNPENSKSTIASINNTENNKASKKQSYTKRSSIITDDNHKNNKKQSKNKRTSNKQTDFSKDNTLKSPENHFTNNSIIDNPKQSIAFVDTLVVYDTVKYFDTLIYKSPLQKLKKTNIWSLTPHVNLFESNPTYYSSEKQNSEFIDLNNQAVSNNISYSFGLGINYDLNNWRFSTGVDYSVIQEEFNYKTQETKTTPATKYKLKENGFYTIIKENTTYLQEPKYEIQNDTISVYYTVEKIEFEHYTVLDTTWKYEISTHLVKVSDSTASINYDTIRVATYDTSYYNTIDTNIYTTYYQNINKYSYLEIPFSVGYAININKLTLRPTMGALVGIMLNAKGNGISMDNKNQVYRMSDLNLPFMNIQVSLLFGLGIEYKIQNNLSLVLQPYYRRNISSIYQSDNYIDKRFSGVGLSFGMTYFFL